MHVGSIALDSGFFGDGEHTPGVTGVNCTGDEMTLYECDFQSLLPSETCRKNAEVICRSMCIYLIVVGT